MPSHVSRHFNIFVYNEDGKRYTVNNHYFCKECLDTAIATDGDLPFKGTFFCHSLRLRLLASFTFRCRIKHYLKDEHVTDEGKVAPRSVMKDLKLLHNHRLL